MKEEPVLPQKGGCKLGWWSYAGYCYKDFGFDPGFGTDGHMTYNQGNNSCSADWAGARMAILPSIQHNHLLAALLGPGRYHNDIWIGVYNWAHSDYYFSLDNTQKLNYDNWATVLSLNSFKMNHFMPKINLEFNLGHDKTHKKAFQIMSIAREPFTMNASG